jgi:hypothetical protein
MGRERHRNFLQLGGGDDFSSKISHLISDQEAGGLSAAGEGPAEGEEAERGPAPTAQHPPARQETVQPTTHFMAGAVQYIRVQIQPSEYKFLKKTYDWIKFD